MALESEFPTSFGNELLGLVRERGIVPAPAVKPVQPRSGYEHLHKKPLPSAPLAVAVDIYGTLLASAVGEPGTAFPPDMAARLREFVDADHALAKAQGIIWPEVDAISIFARVLEQNGSDSSREAAAMACARWECASNPCSAMPGAARFLALCREMHLPLGLVSNAQFYTSYFVEAAFGVPLFPADTGNAVLGETMEQPGKVGNLGFDPDLALWSYRTGRAKPDRWMFDELASRMAGRGIPPERVLYVGNDALNDCACAGEAGFMAALFGGDERSFKPRLEEARVLSTPPSTFIRSWDELGRLLCI